MTVKWSLVCKWSSTKSYSQVYSNFMFHSPWLDGALAQKREAFLVKHGLPKVKLLYMEYKLNYAAIGTRIRISHKYRLPVDGQCKCYEASSDSRG